ncbi:MAG: hypothetical protein COT00_04245 [Candidatus Omnitrophica bacterium CG07_land_8_20_14_0_80_50_8]|nr:MAG: hypothetical protein COT00_04245 [Candidatus Omnitrophica bacterium CG07_land_8_20_14_0_80_50_8]
MTSKVIKKIKSIICFIRSAADFNNPIGLVSSKIFSNTNVIVYRYHQYRLLSFESFADGVSIRECLSEKIYHEALKRSCPKGGSGTYVNLGANIGAFDIALNSVWSGCSVKGVSVEMNPWTCARLASNIHWNRLDTRVLNAAVGPARGETSLDIAKTGPGQSLYHSVPDSRATAVNMIKLSDVPSPATPADVDLLKVDCEGSEYPIFMSANAAELKRFKNIVMEVHLPPPGHTREALVERMKTEGRYDALLLGSREGAQLIFFSRSQAGNPAK